MNGHLPVYNYLCTLTAVMWLNSTIMHALALIERHLGISKRHNPVPE